MNAIKRLLSGSLPLPRALGYLLLGSIVAALALGAIGGMVIIASPPLRVPTYITGFFLLWAYVLAAAIGTWRSAGRTVTGRLRLVAKAIVVLLAAYFLLIFFQSNGVLSMMQGTWQPGSYLQEKMKQ